MLQVALTTKVKSDLTTMFARFLWFFSLIATITTYSMAFQCYQGDNEATTEVTCNLGWCLNGTLPSGDVKYICDSSGACPIFGKGCHDNQAVELGGFKALCCCNSDLCNKAVAGGNCLHCICLHESGCKPSGCRMNNGTLSCGYYQINKAYYEDCGQPGGKGEEAWKGCSDDYNCATTCVQKYVSKYAYKCQGVGLCQQMARIHNGGPNGCNDEGTIGYWNAIRSCCSCS